MTRMETLGKLLYRGFLPIILPDELSVMPTLEQVVAVGLETVELSARRKGVLSLLAEAKRNFPQLALGVSGLLEDGRLRDHLLRRGTELPSIAEAAEAGADFLSSNAPLADATYDRYRSTHILMPGVATLGEAVTALDRGANLLRLIVPHLSGGTSFLRALDQQTQQCLPICTFGQVRFELQAGYIAAGSLLCGAGFDTILGPDYRPMQRAFDEEYVQDGLMRFLLPIDRIRRTLLEGVPFASKDPLAIAAATGRCLNV